MPASQNDYRGKTRLNNPPIGLVDENETPGAVKKSYAYDPHLDPSLHWAGKAERTSFEVPTVSLHTHERIDPQRVLKAIRRKNVGTQGDLFAPPDLPLADAIEFYKHAQNWENRLVAGDSLLVMNSLLEKESLAGAVQMIYFDPPYGIKYQSNFQPFTDKRDVKDGSDQDLSSEPEMIKAFRDTWQLGIHSYLTYLRDRLLLAHELLAESGSVFVQIGDENIHHVRALMDEVFDKENFVSVITIRKTRSATAELLANTTDFMLWYAKNKSQVFFRQLYTDKLDSESADRYDQLELSDGTRRPMTLEEKNDLAQLPKNSKRFQLSAMTSSRPPGDFEVLFNGKVFRPRTGYWKTGTEGFSNLINSRRIVETSGGTLRYVRYLEDFPVIGIDNVWADIYGSVQSRSDPKVYVVQTSTTAIARCLLMTTSPGDLVLDITCGSGTTAYVAEQWGRRWITCDTSRVAIALAKQRLMTAVFPYYRLRSEQEGVAGDFHYEEVRHVTLKSIANNEPAPMEKLYDKPIVDKKRVRVTSPFTVEAVPSAAVAASPDEVSREMQLSESSKLSESSSPSPANTAVRLQNLLDELMTKGVRGKSGQRIHFQNLELLATAAGGSDLNLSHVQARAEEKLEIEKLENDGIPGSPSGAGGGVVGISPSGAGGGVGGAVGGGVAIVVGNEFTPVDKSWIDKAMGQAFVLRPKVKKVLFLAWQFDAGVHEYVEKSTWGGMDILLAQIDTDLLVEDLKKKQKGDSFWLIGQPDVRLRLLPSPPGEGSGVRFTVSVHGFDYYNVAEQKMESGGRGDIAMWLLDTDYNDRYLHPTQIFFPMADGKTGWQSLSKTLSAEVDPELAEAYRGTESLPFELGERRQVAVKVIDKRGVESMRILKPSGER